MSSTAGNVSQVCSRTSENPSLQLGKIVFDVPDMVKNTTFSRVPSFYIYMCVCAVIPMTITAVHALVTL